MFWKVEYVGNLIFGPVLKTLIGEHVTMHLMLPQLRSCNHYTAGYHELTVKANVASKHYTGVMRYLDIERHSAYTLDG